MADMTIAIPTFEGDPALLRRVLGAAVAQAEVPPMVVDMSATDIVSDACAEVGGLEYVALPGSSGLSESRNAATARASTRYLLFLDSDAVPEPGWAEAMRAGFEEERVAIVGARVLAAWERRPPALFTTATAADWLSMFDLGERSREVPRVVGTSHALDLDRTGRAPFDESLGRKPGDAMGHEEVSMALAAKRAGWRCWYAAGAVVHHHLPPARGTWGYMLRRAFTAGRELALESDRLEPLPRELTLRDHAFRALVAPAVLAGRLRGV
jgi:GT2 family glycosyltransferase